MWDALPPVTATNIGAGIPAVTDAGAAVGTALFAQPHSASSGAVNAAMSDDRSLGSYGEPGHRAGSHGQPSPTSRSPQGQRQQQLPPPIPHPFSPAPHPTGATASSLEQSGSYSYLPMPIAIRSDAGTQLASIPTTLRKRIDSDAVDVPALPAFSGSSTSEEVADAAFPNHGSGRKERQSAQAAVAGRPRRASSQRKRASPLTALQSSTISQGWTSGEEGNGSLGPDGLPQRRYMPGAERRARIGASLPSLTASFASSMVSPPPPADPHSRSGSHSSPPRASGDQQQQGQGGDAVDVPPLHNPFRTTATTTTGSAQRARTPEAAEASVSLPLPSVAVPAPVPEPQGGHGRLCLPREDPLSGGSHEHLPHSAAVVLSATSSACPATTTTTTTATAAALAVPGPHPSSLVSCTAELSEASPDCADPSTSTSGGGGGLVEVDALPVPNEFTEHAERPVSHRRLHRGPCQHQPRGGQQQTQMSPGPLSHNGGAEVASSARSEAFENYHSQASPTFASGCSFDPSTTDGAAITTATTTIITEMGENAHRLSFYQNNSSMARSFFFPDGMGGAHAPPPPAEDSFLIASSTPQRDYTTYPTLPRRTAPQGCPLSPSLRVPPTTAPGGVSSFSVGDTATSPLHHWRDRPPQHLAHNSGDSSTGSTVWMSPTADSIAPSNATTMSTHTFTSPGLRPSHDEGSRVWRNHPQRNHASFTAPRQQALPVVARTPEQPLPVHPQRGAVISLTAADGAGDNASNSEGARTLSLTSGAPPSQDVEPLSLGRCVGSSAGWADGGDPSTHSFRSPTLAASFFAQRPFGPSGSGNSNSGPVAAAAAATAAGDRLPPHHCQTSLPQSHRRQESSGTNRSDGAGAGALGAANARAPACLYNYAVAIDDVPGVKDHDHAQGSGRGGAGGSVPAGGPAVYTYATVAQQSGAASNSHSHNASICDSFTSAQEYSRSPTPAQSTSRPRHPPQPQPHPPSTSQGHQHHQPPHSEHAASGKEEEEEKSKTAPITSRVGTLAKPAAPSQCPPPPPPPPALIDLQKEFEDYTQFKGQCTEAYLTRIERTVDAFLTSFYNPTGDRSASSAAAAAAAGAGRATANGAGRGTAALINKAGARLTHWFRQATANVHSGSGSGNYTPHADGNGNNSSSNTGAALAPLSSSETGGVARPSGAMASSSPSPPPPASVPTASTSPQPQQQQCFLPHSESAGSTGRSAVVAAGGGGGGGYGSPLFDADGAGTGRVETGSLSSRSNSPSANGGDPDGVEGGRVTKVPSVTTTPIGTSASGCSSLANSVGTSPPPQQQQQQQQLEQPLGKPSQPAGHHQVASPVPYAMHPLTYAADAVPEDYIDRAPSEGVLRKVELNYPIILHALKHLLPPPPPPADPPTPGSVPPGHAHRPHAIQQPPQEVQRLLASSSHSVSGKTSGLPSPPSLPDTRPDGPSQQQQQQQQRLSAREIAMAMIASPSTEIPYSLRDHISICNDLIVPTIETIWREYLEPLEAKLHQYMAKAATLTHPLRLDAAAGPTVSPHSVTGKDRASTQPSSEPLAQVPPTAMTPQQQQQCLRIHRSLQSDAEYIDTVRAMDEEFVREYARERAAITARQQQQQQQREGSEEGSILSGSSRPLPEENQRRGFVGNLRGAATGAMSDYVPVYGLIMSRLHRLEMEHRTVLELWDPSVRIGRR